MCQRVIIIIILCIPLCVGFIINLLTTLPVLLLDLNVEGTVRERDNATDTKTLCEEPCIYDVHVQYTI